MKFQLCSVCKAVMTSEENCVCDSCRNAQVEADFIAETEKAESEAREAEMEELIKKLGVRFCIKCKTLLTVENIYPSYIKRGNWICRKCSITRERLYYQQPDVKERVRKKSQEYRITHKNVIYERFKKRYHEDSDFRKKVLGHSKKTREKYPERYREGSDVPVVDCLNRDTPVTFTEILEKSGAGAYYARKVLLSLIKISLVEYFPDNNSYRIVPDNPLRFALDGYFKEASKEVV